MGDADDDGELFRSLYPSLRAFAGAVGSWDVEPDDLVQEALARTLRRHRLTDLEQPGPYLRTVIVNLAASAGRRRTRGAQARSRLAPDAARIQPVPSDLSELDRLSPVDRAVLYLVHVEGCSHREAGATLGISEQASRSRSSRAAAQLRKAIMADEASS